MVGLSELGYRTVITDEESPAELPVIVVLRADRHPVFVDALVEVQQDARDIDAMEAWLEDMAAHGLFLTKDGFFCGFGIFRKDTPRPCRYRLAPAAKRPTLWSDDNGAPSEESQALWKRYGWEYLCPARGDGEDTDSRMYIHK